MTRFLLTCFLGAALGGCRPVYFASDIRLQREVDPIEVVGLWRLRPESLNRAKVEGKREGYAPAEGERYEIEFRANGTLHFASLRQMPLSFVDSEGTWALRHEKGGPRPNELILRLKHLTFALEFTEEDGRLVLWDYLGDPDDWLFLKYDKQAKPSSPPTVASGRG